MELEPKLLAVLMAVLHFVIYVVVRSDTPYIVMHVWIGWWVFFYFYELRATEVEGEDT